MPGPVKGLTRAASAGSLRPVPQCMGCSLIAVPLWQWEDFRRCMAKASESQVVPEATWRVRGANAPQAPPVWP